MEGGKVFLTFPLFIINNLNVLIIIKKESSSKDIFFLKKEK